MFANHDHPIQRGRVFALIHSYLPNLSPAETRIAEYILRNPERCLNLGIVEMAKECSVSPAMVTRFTTKIGFTGFAAMKATLRVDILASDGRFFEDIEIGDSANAIMEKVLDLAILGLQDTAATLDTSELVRAAKAILNARPLFFAPAGVSSTGVIMLYRQKLINLGILAVPPPDHSVASTYVSMVKPGMLCSAYPIRALPMWQSTSLSSAKNRSNHDLFDKLQQCPNYTCLGYSPDHRGIALRRSSGKR